MSKSMSRLSLMLVCALSGAGFAATVEASVRHYVADVAQSDWALGEATPLTCELEHEIPRFGSVEFVSEAGKELNLRMRMNFRQLPDTYDVAAVKSVAPQWWPGQPTYDLGDMDLYKQFDSELPKAQAWTVLTELEKGRYPTFFYQDWYNQRDQVAVALAAPNFRRGYDEFLDCVAQLLDFSFDDISYSVLTYESGGDELTNSAKEKLMQIGTYLHYDQDLELVLIDAYTDAFGAREPNQRLSEERAEAIKEFFVERGIAANRITTVGHGERRHVAGNDDELSRATNRRVVVQLNKPADFDLTASN